MGQLKAKLSAATVAHYKKAIGQASSATSMFICNLHLMGLIERAGP